MADSFIPVQVDFFDGNLLNDPNLLVDNLKKNKNGKKKKLRKLFLKYIIILNNIRIRGYYLVGRVLREGVIGREVIPLALIRLFYI